jgi:hypothetical protein
VAIADKIRNLIPFLRGPIRLPGEVARSLKPIRSPEVKWRSEGVDNLTVIYSARPKDQFWVAWLAKMANEPEERKTELDEIGSKIWGMCDGSHRVAEICRLIAAEYQLTDRQVEVSVLQFLNMLRTRRFVGLTEEDKLKVDIATGKVKAGSASDGGNATNGKTSSGRKRSKQKRH